MGFGVGAIGLFFLCVGGHFFLPGGGESSGCWSVRGLAKRPLMESIMGPSFIQIASMAQW